MILNLKYKKLITNGLYKIVQLIQMFPIKNVSKISLNDKKIFGLNFFYMKIKRERNKELKFIIQKKKVKLMKMVEQNLWIK